MGIDNLVHTIYIRFLKLFFFSTIFSETFIYNDRDNIINNYFIVISIKIGDVKKWKK